jgi:hypothetical protein
MKNTMIKRLNRAHASCFAAVGVMFCCVALLPTAARSAEAFNDDHWTSLGGSRGPNGTVMAAVVDASGTNLYIGGFFTMAGETKASRIAKWDGNSWTALGSGINGGVYALVWSGNDLYVAGSFTSAGGVAATNIAKWNGSSWSALGSGLNGNQSSWSLLVSGLSGYVSAMAVSGSDLYAAGSFTKAGGVAATNIAKWDAATLLARLKEPRRALSFSNFLRKEGGLSPIAIGLVHETAGDQDARDHRPEALTALIKALPLRVLAPFPIDKAISTAGGIKLDALTDLMMLQAKPGVFVAGEMLDWEAPTGGYLLQATFSTAARAARGALAWLR